ncbi:MAG: magnesium/cobalt transporter CorA [bacterium]
MIKSFLIEQNNLKSNISAEEIREVIKNKPKDTYIWVDIEGDTDEENIFILSDVFEFHALTIEECIFPSDNPKVNRYDSYLFIVMHAIGIIKEDEIETFELNVFLGENYLVTFHPFPIKNISIYQQNSKKILQQKSPDFLLYSFTNALMENYSPLIAQIDKQLDKLENELLKDPTNKKLEEIFGLKKKILLFIRIIIPQKETIGILSRMETSFIKSDTKIYFRDVYEQYIRISETIISYRDMLTNTLDAYTSMISNRLNEVMKVLTSISTIILPLTFIASLYGMNFKFMPEIYWKYGYFVTLGVMATIVVVLLIFFKKKKWF